jgi:hypothetical protein
LAQFHVISRYKRSEIWRIAGGIENDPVETPVMILPGGVVATQIPSYWLGERSHPGQKSIDDPPPPPGPPPPPPPLLAVDLVVVTKVPITHPIISVALLEVEYDGDDTSLTTIVSPEFVVPVSVVKAALLILYSPPTIEIVDAAVIPKTVIGADVYGVESSALVTAEKLNASGIVSVGGANAKSESWFVVNIQAHTGVMIQVPKLV